MSAESVFLTRHGSAGAYRSELVDLGNDRIYEFLVRSIFGSEGRNLSTEISAFRL